MPDCIVIGAGIAGLASAIKLADQGLNVLVLEKNSSIGGRARVFEENGFIFDMGPSWYWMPDILEEYLEQFNKKPSDYFDLKRLDPSYQVILKSGNTIKLPANYQELKAVFENLEAGSANNLDEFLELAEQKYKIGMGEFVKKPSHSVLEFLDIRLATKAFSLDLFSSLASHARKFFKNEDILEILEFPVLFLGATPEDTPALYSLMNYAEIKLGTWYPMGGMHKIIEAFEKLAIEKGVKFLTNKEVLSLKVENGKITNIICKDESYQADIIIANADYAHVEMTLLPSEFRNYSDKYWDSRVMAPSSLLFYLGLNKKIPNLEHHNLFFDEDFKQHAYEIYKEPKWPTKPLFYVCCPSKTDNTVAPEGYENVFLLMPIAPNLNDTEELREVYFEIMVKRLENFTKTKIKDSILYKKSYAINDFKSDYNAYKGNAYGLANTLKQTAILKPKMKSKKIENLYFTGQLTVPGPGVPPAIISGNMVANEILKQLNYA